MLDKRTKRVLLELVKICNDGSYKIIEKTELLKLTRSQSAGIASLDQTVRYLQDNEMLDVKYIDETVYCLTVLPKGRVECEPARSNRDEVALGIKTILIIAGIVFVASFIGGFLGALFAGLV